MTGYVSTRYYRAPEIMLTWQKYDVAGTSRFHGITTNVIAYVSHDLFGSRHLEYWMHFRGNVGRKTFVPRKGP